MLVKSSNEEEDVTIAQRSYLGKEKEEEVTAAMIHQKDKDEKYAEDNKEEGDMKEEEGVTAKR